MSRRVRFIIIDIGVVVTPWGLVVCGRGTWSFGIGFLHFNLIAKPVLNVSWRPFIVAGVDAHFILYV